MAVVGRAAVVQPGVPVLAKIFLDAGKTVLVETSGERPIGFGRWLP